MAKNRANLTQIIISDFIKPVLKKEGFKKQNNSWTFDQGDFVFLINLQRSRYNSAASESFTLNIGVWIEKIWRIVWNTPRPVTLHETDCFPAFRVGQLIGNFDDFYDNWFSLEKQSDVKRVGLEIQDVIVNSCLPFFNEIQSINDVCEIALKIEKKFHAADKIAYAILKAISGHEEEAIILLDQMESDMKLKAWHSRISEAKSRLMEG